MSIIEINTHDLSILYVRLQSFHISLDKTLSAMPAKWVAYAFYVKHIPMDVGVTNYVGPFRLRPWLYFFRASASSGDNGFPESRCRAMGVRAALTHSSMSVWVTPSSFCLFGVGDTGSNDSLLIMLPRGSMAYTPNQRHANRKLILLLSSRCSFKYPMALSKLSIAILSIAITPPTACKTSPSRRWYRASAGRPARSRHM